MTLAILFANLWLWANLFLQAVSVPIWLPLIIILLITILVWWGLSGDRSRRGSESSSHHDRAAGDLENGDDLSPQANTVLPGDADRHGEDAAESDVVEIDEPQTSSPEPADFKIIEGIGPKIADILVEAGISSYDQLANSDVADLERIVRVEAGIRVANPASWPQQAAFAAAGDWVGLEEMQQRLVAGRLRD